MITGAGVTLLLYYLGSYGLEFDSAWPGSYPPIPTSAHLRRFAPITCSASTRACGACFPAVAGVVVSLLTKPPD